MESTTVSAPGVSTDKIKVSKPPRIRSAPYPSMSLDGAVKLTEKIDKEFTSVIFTPLLEISKAVGISGGTFNMQVSSCVQYGLLELKLKEGYRPSPLFTKIKRPLPEENVNDSLIEALQKPDLYRKLIAEFNEKQLPTESGLANILDRKYNVKGNAAITAAKIFIKNIQSLGLVTQDNILRINSYIPFIEEKEKLENQSEGDDTGEKVNAIVLPPAPSPPAQSPAQQKLPTNEGLNQSGVKTIPIFLKGEDREVLILMPTDFDEDDKKRVIRFLNTYVP